MIDVKRIPPTRHEGGVNFNIVLIESNGFVYYFMFICLTQILILFSLIFRMVLILGFDLISHIFDLFYIVERC